ncbi:glycoside hydrolase family 76 protein [Dysgonomonas capnocytophagoides]|uniref:glycoside hydrolase family 76 protein n=1 Tax=Dysgonomonas capnocytophagoides TaxID=45254 RepID=UPI0029213304|nr:glycoside hydrolase family 76 protein [Dysgonomonas capnocytophagoides]
MNKANRIFPLLFLFLSVACATKSVHEENTDRLRAQQTLDSLYKYYSVEGSNLLTETYPLDSAHTATYLASAEQANVPNAYSYLWPYSGTFSAINVLIAAGDTVYNKKVLDNRVLPGLEEYLDTKRQPAAYASYINSAPESDRFYDDNVWLGIDFTDIYMQTKQQSYLDKAKMIWKFIESGTDDKLGGGIYWCEQKKSGKNTCSNAPGAVYALKLFEATNDSSYFYQGKKLYEWTKKNLQDTEDYLYFDNINMEGKVDKAKYPYNSGQMLQASALLYKLTKNKDYLTDAQNIAKSGYNYFFTDFKTSEGEEFRLLKKSDVWFIAVMFRGYIELYNLDKNDVYINAFRKNLEYAWTHMRDEKGLFSTDWTGEKKDDKKWLLTQAAFVEFYGRLAEIKNTK